MLVLNNIEVKYAGIILALRGVSLTVDDGEIVALLGGNGAGKSTALKAISGLLKTAGGAVTGGSIEFDGARIDTLAPQDVVRRGVAQVIEGRHVFQYLTVAENLAIGAYCRRDGRVRHDLAAVYEYFPKLKGLQGTQAGYLSGGEQQMLVIGRAIMTAPKLLLLDEPSLGLAPMVVQEIFEIVKRFREERSVSVLVVEQHAPAALGIADRAFVIENGKMALGGKAEELRNNPQVRESYMGLSSSGAKKSFRALKHYKRRKRWV